MDVFALVAVNSAMSLGLAVAGVAVWRLWRQTPLAHALLLLALIKLVTPPLFDVPVPLPAMSVAPPIEAAAAWDHAESRAVVAWPELPPAHQLPEASLPPVAPAAALPWDRLLLGLWGCGSLLMVVVVFRRARRCQSLLDCAEPAPAGVQAQARDLAARLGLRRPPRLCIVDGRLPPFVFALGRRPTVVLPRCLLDELTPGDMRAVLAHELAHLANRDHWTRWLELVAVTVHWWNPVAHWLRRRLQEVGEVRCDARAVEALAAGARTYGHALLRITSRLDFDPTEVPLGASAFGGAKALKRRLTMIANSKLTHRLSNSGRLALAACAVVLLPFGLDAQDPDKSEAKEKKKVEARQRFWQSDDDGDHRLHRQIRARVKAALKGLDQLEGLEGLHISLDGEDVAWEDLDAKIRECIEEAIEDGGEAEFFGIDTDAAPGSRASAGKAAKRGHAIWFGPNGAFDADEFKARMKKGARAGWIARVGSGNAKFFGDEGFDADAFRQHVKKLGHEARVFSIDRSNARFFPADLDDEVRDAIEKAAESGEGRRFRFHDFFGLRDDDDEADDADEDRAASDRDETGDVGELKARIRRLERELQSLKRALKRRAV